MRGFSWIVLVLIVALHAELALGGRDVLCDDCHRKGRTRKTIILVKRRGCDDDACLRCPRDRNKECGRCPPCKDDTTDTTAETKTAPATEDDTEKSPTPKESPAPSDSPTPDDESTTTPSDSPTPDDDSTTTPSDSPTPDDESTTTPSDSPTPDDEDESTTKPSPTPSTKRTASPSPTPDNDDKESPPDSPTPKPTTPSASDLKAGYRWKAGTEWWELCGPCSRDPGSNTCSAPAERELQGGFGLKRMSENQGKVSPAGAGDCLNCDPSSNRPCPQGMKCKPGRRDLSPETMKREPTFGVATCLPA